MDRKEKFDQWYNILLGGNIIYFINLVFSAKLRDESSDPLEIRDEDKDNY